VRSNAIANISRADRQNLVARVGELLTGVEHADQERLLVYWAHDFVENPIGPKRRTVPTGIGATGVARVVVSGL